MFVRTVWVWCWRRKWRVSLFLVVLGFLGLNIFAIVHVRAMTEYVRSGERTAKPEDLRFFGKVRVLLTGVTLPRRENEKTPGELGMKFGVHEVTRGEERLEVWSIPVEDEGAPVVMLFHGYSASKADLLGLAKVFHEMGFAVVMTDFYGSGGSSGSSTTLGYREGEDVKAVVEFVRGSWPSRRVVVYGISMGAAAVLRAVGELGVEVDALVVDAVFDDLTHTIRRRFSAMGLPSWPAADLMMIWGGWMGGFDAGSVSPREYARGVKVPALVLQGELDPRATPADGRVVFDHLSSEVKAMHVFDGLGHVLAATRERAEWEVEVRNFFLAAGILLPDEKAGGGGDGEEEE